LKKLGLTDKKIATNANLLTMNPKTIHRNYQHHVGLLRQNYEERNLGRESITRQGSYLGIPPETINTNVQYLSSLGIDYHKGPLLGTTTQLKRKKMVWLLREVFDYRDLSDEQKPVAIKKMYDFLRDNSYLLVQSISALGKSKDKIREKISR